MQENINPDSRNRFQPVSEDDILQILNQPNNENTLKTTKSHMNTFFLWQQMNPTHPQSPLETLEEVVIDQLLQHFILGVRKEDGDYYNSKSLYSKIAAIQRYLLDITKGSKGNILDKTNYIYKGTRDVLDKECKRLTRLGHGNSKQSKYLSSENEKKILDICNSNEPEGLLNRVIIHIHKGFSLRGQAGEKLYVEEVVPKVDDNNKRYFGWFPSPEKNNVGGINEIQKGYEQKERRIYEVGGPYCPYTDIEKYLSKRPKPNSCATFFLQVRKNIDNDVWYKNQPISSRTLSERYKKICSSAGLEGKFTLHGLRATIPTRWFQEGVSEKEIMDQTGHRSLVGVRKYIRTSDNQQFVNQLKSSVQPSPENVPIPKQFEDKLKLVMKPITEIVEKPNIPKPYIPEIYNNVDYLISESIKHYEEEEKRKRKETQKEYEAHVQVEKRKLDEMLEIHLSGNHKCNISIQIQISRFHWSFNL